MNVSENYIPGLGECNVEVPNLLSLFPNIYRVLGVTPIQQELPFLDTYNLLNRVNTTERKKNQFTFQIISRS